MESIDMYIGMAGILVTSALAFWVKSVLTNISKLPHLIGRFNELLEEVKELLKSHHKLMTEVNVVTNEMDNIKSELSDMRQTRAKLADEVFVIKGEINSIKNKIN